MRLLPTQPLTCQKGFISPFPDGRAMAQEWANRGYTYGIAVLIVATLAMGAVLAGKPVPCPHLSMLTRGVLGASSPGILSPCPQEPKYFTYLGGGATESGPDVAVDVDGNVYVAGHTSSSDFPATVGDTTVNGGRGAFVAKFSPTLGTLVWATLLDGDSVDNAWAIEAQGGSVFVTGETISPDFPTTLGAFDRSWGGTTYDVFIARLDAATGSLLYSTFLGGTGRDRPHEMKVGPSGSLVLVGQTDSDADNVNDFPTTPGAFDRTWNSAGPGNFDGFLVKFAPLGNGEGDLLYSTFLGGSGDDHAMAVAVDSAGEAYITGYTNSADFPTTPGGFDISISGYDAFATKINPTGGGSADLLYSTFLGGSGFDAGYGIANDTAGNAYVHGSTTSTGFPVTPGAFDTRKAGPATSPDGFLTKLNPAGSSLVYSTFLGGKGSENPSSTSRYGIDVDSAGDAYVHGQTSSTDFPTTSDGYDRSYNGVADAYLTRLNAAGDALVYSTYLGGSASDQGWSIYVDGAVYLTGTTESSNFPTSPGAYDTTHNGSSDAFIAVLA